MRHRRAKRRARMLQSAPTPCRSVGGCQRGHRGCRDANERRRRAEIGRIKIGREVSLRSRFWRTCGIGLTGTTRAADTDATAAMPVARTLTIAVPVRGRSIVANHMLKSWLGGSACRRLDSHRRCGGGEACRQCCDKVDGFKHKTTPFVRLCPQDEVKGRHLLIVPHEGRLG